MTPYKPKLRVIRPWAVARVQLRMLFVYLWLLGTGRWGDVQRTVTITHSHQVKWTRVTTSVDYLMIRYENGPVMYQSSEPGSLEEAQLLEADFWRALKNWRATGAKSSCRP